MVPAQYLLRCTKLVICGINLPKNVISLLSNFYKFGMVEGITGPHHHAKFHRCGFKNVGLPIKSSKNGNCWYTFPPKRKSWRSTDKLEYKCATTNLRIRLCNSTITILKIHCLIAFPLSQISSFESKLEINVHHLWGHAIPCAAFLERFQRNFMSLRDS